MTQNTPQGVEIPFPGYPMQPVGRPNVFPTRTIGELIMEWPKGTYAGTGTLLTGQIVLTCAHNLWSKDLGGYAESVHFAACRRGGDLPYKDIRAKALWTPGEYRALAPANPNEHNGVADEVTHYLFDYGLILLERAVDQEDFLPLFEMPDPVGLAVTVTGYPVPASFGHTMYESSAPVDQGGGDDFLFYRASTLNGESGSAIQAVINNVRVVGGIHVAGVPQGQGTNFAVRMKGDVIANLNGVIRRWEAGQT